ncbi:hypothetical protein D3C87_1082040 [compost metagenome]
MEIGRQFVQSRVVGQHRAQGRCGGVGVVVRQGEDRPLVRGGHPDIGGPGRDRLAGFVDRVVVAVGIQFEGLDVAAVVRGLVFGRVLVLALQRLELVAVARHGHAGVVAGPDHAAQCVVERPAHVVARVHAVGAAATGEAGVDEIVHALCIARLVAIVQVAGGPVGFLRRVAGEPIVVVALDLRPGQPAGPACVARRRQAPADGEGGHVLPERGVVLAAHRGNVVGERLGEIRMPEVAGREVGEPVAAGAAVAVGDVRVSGVQLLQRIRAVVAGRTFRVVAECSGTCRRLAVEIDACAAGGLLRVDALRGFRVPGAIGQHDAVGAPAAQFAALRVVGIVLPGGVQGGRRDGLRRAAGVVAGREHQGVVAWCSSLGVDAVDPVVEAGLPLLSVRGRFVPEVVDATHDAQRIVSVVVVLDVAHPELVVIALHRQAQGGADRQRAGAVPLIPVRDVLAFLLRGALGGIRPAVGTLVAEGQLDGVGSGRIADGGLGPVCGAGTVTVLALDVGELSRPGRCTGVVIRSSVV